MNYRIPAAAIFALFSFWLSRNAVALDGEPYIYDPSTVIECDGKFYTFGTGGGGLISEDGWTWRSAIPHILFCRFAHRISGIRSIRSNLE